MTYVELHCHSAYSFLDGASQPEELAAAAAELGYEALALTDHDGVSGSLEFAHAAKALGVRPITGAEVTLLGGTHVTLLVETGFDGAPREVNRRTVALVREEWRVVDRWWTEEPVSRRYFDVVLESGENAVVFRDEEAGSWFSQRGA